MSTTPHPDAGAPLRFESPDQGEDLARADLYGLLAELFYAPPGAERLGQIALARDENDTLLGAAWNALVDAAQVSTASQVASDYEYLFGGVGKPLVLLYGSYYLSGFLMEKPLAALRTDLALLGLERAQQVNESEDHIAALCEVMRFLIASDDAPPDISVQKRFYGAHLQPWVDNMCLAVEAAATSSAFYLALARFARAFFAVESQAFDMV